VAFVKDVGIGNRLTIFKNHIFPSCTTAVTRVFQKYLVKVKHQECSPLAEIYVIYQDARIFTPRVWMWRTSA
jgi:hypothetical protein